ncbi:hypothetical protein [Halorientalis halophila]|uniref:hypothetical protein n=1 Tax=Halorientalis halophila TaxID=3108499 RepID=UPI003008781F
MPDSGLVVSDTSPLLNLALIDRLDLLESQFPGIAIPEQVWSELTAGDDGLDVVRELRENGFLTVVEVAQSDLFVEIFHELDLGSSFKSAGGTLPSLANCSQREMGPGGL